MLEFQVLFGASSHHYYLRGEEIMKAFLSKMSFLVILAVMTAVFTSNIMAQRKSRSSDQASRFTTPVSKPATSRKVNPNATPAPQLATFDRESMSATVSGDAVFVEMVASIFDIRPTISYVWGLKVKSPDGRQTLSEKIYRDQVFTLQGEKNAKPAFSELLDLDSGRYLIEVSLYEFPTGFNLDELAKQETEMGQRAVSGIERVTIR